MKQYIFDGNGTLIEEVDLPDPPLPPLVDRLREIINKAPRTGVPVEFRKLVRSLQSPVRDAIEAGDLETARGYIVDTPIPVEFESFRQQLLAEFDR